MRVWRGKEGGGVGGVGKKRKMVYFVGVWNTKPSCDSVPVKKKGGALCQKICCVDKLSPLKRRVVLVQPEKNNEGWKR